MRKLLRHVKTVTLLFLLNAPLVVFAQQSDNPGRGPGGGIFIENPLGRAGINSIPDLIKKILEIVMEIGIPLAAMGIIYSGFLYVTAGGKQDQISKAHQALKWSLVGTAVILGAYVIVSAIKSTVNGLQA